MPTEQGVPKAPRLTIEFAGDTPVYPSENGGWVRYKDHAAEVEQIRDQVLGEVREAAETFIRRADDSSLHWSETVAEFRAALATLTPSEDTTEPCICRGEREEAPAEPDPDCPVHGQHGPPPTDEPSKNDAPSVADQFPEQPEGDETEAKRWPQNPNDLLGKLQASFKRPSEGSGAPLPEGGAESCRKCGRGNAIWFAPSPLWNAVIRGGSINGQPKFGDMVCASCFMELAEEQGIATRFRVSAEEVMVPLETTTPSGRTWDEGSWLWRDPDARPLPEGEKCERCNGDGTEAHPFPLNAPCPTCKACGGTGKKGKP